MSHSCPSCSWEHTAGDAHWACKQCEAPFDAFGYHSDRSGICLDCRQVHVRIVCPSCQEWTRFSEWLDPEPLSNGDKLGLVVGLLAVMPVGWNAHALFMPLGSESEAESKLGLLAVALAVIVVPVGIGVALQWLVDGRLSPHARSFVTDLRGLLAPKTQGTLGSVENMGFAGVSEAAGLVKAFRDMRRDQAEEHIRRPPGAVLVTSPSQGSGRRQRRRR